VALICNTDIKDIVEVEAMDSVFDLVLFVCFESFRGKIVGPVKQVGKTMNYK
jgi:hypothetical protein